MPRFQINCKRSITLTASLVNIPSCIVENSQHGNYAIRGAISASNMTTGSPDIVYM